MSNFRIKVVYWIFLFLFYALASSQAIQSFSYKWTVVADVERFSLQEILEFETPKPFIYRAFMPYVINAVIEYTPQELQQILHDRSVLALHANLGKEKTNLMDYKFITSYGLILILDFVFLVSTLFMLKAIAKYILADKSKGMTLFFVDVSPILFTLMLSLSYRTHNGFIYDHFELFCLTAYILCCYTNKSTSSLVFLAFAILNKETAVFFPVFGLAIAFVLNNMKMKKSLLLKFSYELLVVLCGYILIHYIFYEWPGGVVEHHALGNLTFWLSIEPWLMTFTTPHMALVPLPKPSNIVFFFAILCAIFGAWSSKPNLIKIPLIVSLVINLPLFLFFCYRDEFRNLSLTFPFIYLASVHSIIMFYTNYLQNFEGLDDKK